MAQPRAELVLDEVLLGTKVFRDDWRALLSVETMRLLSATIGDADASDNFSVTGKATLLGYVNAEIELRFFMAREGADAPAPACMILVQKQAVPWSLTRAFGELPGQTDYSRPELPTTASILSGIDFSDFRCAYSTVDFRPRAPGAPILETSLIQAASFEGRLLRAGLNFRASTTAAGAAFARLRSLAPSVTSFDIVGTIENGIFAPEMELFAPISGVSLNLIGDDALTLKLERVAITSGLGANGAGPSFKVYASLGDEDFAAQMMVQFFEGSDRAKVGLAFGNDVIEGSGDTNAQLLTIDRIARLFGLGDVTGSLPGPLSDVGRAGLRDLEMDLSLSPLSVSGSICTLACEKSIDVLPGFFSVSPVLRVHARDPLVASQRQTRIELSGIAKLGSTKFEVFLEPRSGNYRVQMSVGESLDIGALMSALLPTGVTLPAVSIVSADFEGNVRTGYCKVYLDVIDLWSFDVSGKEFAISELQIELERKPGSLAGEITGRLVIADQEVVVSAQVGETVELSLRLEELQVSSLANDMLSLVTLPASVPDFALRDLAMRLKPKTKAFYLSGASDSVIPISESVNFGVTYFEVERSDDEQLRCLLNGALSVGDVKLQLAARREGKAIGQEGWHFSGATAAGVTIDGGKLLMSAAAMADVSLPDLSGAFEARDLQVTYDAGNKLWSSTARCTLRLDLPWTANDLHVDGQFALRTERDPGTSQKRMAGTVEARADIGSMNVGLRGQVENGGLWQGEASNVNLSALVNQLLGQVGLPAEIPDLVLSKATLSFQRGAGQTFRIEATSDSALSIHDVVRFGAPRLLAERRKKDDAVSVRFGGEVALAGVTATLTTEVGPRTSFSGTFSRLPLGQLADEIFSSALDEAGPIGLGIRTALGVLTLKDATVTVSGAGSGAGPMILVAGKPDGIDARVELGAVKSNGKWRMVVGLVPGPNFRFDSLLGDGAGFLDGILSDKSSMFIGMAPQGFSGGGSTPSGMNLPTSYSSAPGIAIAAALSLRGTGVDELFGMDSIRVNTVFRSPTDVMLSAVLMEDKGDTGGILQFRGLQLNVRCGNVPTFGISGRLVLKIDTPALDFTIACEVAPGAVYLRGDLKEWDTPFGIPGVRLWDVSILVGGSVAIIPSLGISAHAAIGKFEGGAAFRFDPGSPSRSMLALDFKELSLPVLLESIFGDLLPDEVEQINPLALKDVKLQVVPPGASFGGYQEGIAIKGKIALDLGITQIRGEIDGEAALTKGIHLKGSVDRLAIGPQVGLSGGHLLDLTSSDGSAGPSFDLDLQLANFNPHILLNGRARVFGLTIQDSIFKISKDGIQSTFRREFGPISYDASITVSEFDRPENLTITLAGNAAFNLDINVPSYTIPGLGIEIWPGFRLNVSLGGGIEVKAGRTNGLALRGMHFRWDGHGFTVPDLVISAKIEDLSQIPGLINDHILRNIEEIFKELIERVKEKFMIAFRAIEDAAKEVADLFVDLGDQFKEIARLGDELERLVVAGAYVEVSAAAIRAYSEVVNQANYVAYEAEKVANQAADFAKDAVKVLDQTKAIEDAAKTFANEIVKLEKEVEKLFNEAENLANQAAKIATESFAAVEAEFKKVGSAIEGAAREAARALENIGRQIAHHLNPSNW